MRKFYWSILLVLSIILTACEPASSATTVSTAPPTNSITHASGSVTASAEVVPAQKSEMAFAISASVKEVTVKEGDQVKDGQTLIVLDTPDLDAALLSAQAELASAQANVTVQREGHQTRVVIGHKLRWTGAMPEIRQQADARALQAQAGLQLAQANLAQGTLVAPFDGTVVSIDVHVGEVVQPDQVVATIGDLNRLQVETKDLSERDIANVRIGQAAVVHLKAFSQDLKGQVIAISPKTEEYKNDTVVKVTIQLDQQPDGLLWGMTGDVDIQTQ